MKSLKDRRNTTLLLSPALLYRELSAVYPVVSGSNMSLEPTLGRPIFLTEGEPPLPGRLYILSKEDCATYSMPPLPGTLFLIVGMGGRLTPPNQIQVDAPSVGEVYNLVQRIFDRYDAWRGELGESRLQGQSIQALLELSYPILRHPLVVVGMDFSIIASVHGEAVEMVRGVFGSTDSTYSVVTSLKQNEEYHAVRDLDGYFYYHAEYDGANCLCVNIKKYEQTTYRLLMIDTDNRQDLTDGFLLEILAGMVEHALLHNTSPLAVKDQAIRTVLHTAISDRTADYVTVSQRLEASGWHSSHDYLCIVLQLSYLDQKNLTVHAICSYIENILSGSCAFQFKDDIAVFVDLTLSSMSLTDISARLSCFVRDSLLKAGYSRVLLGHFNLRRQYEQACIALEVGSRRNPSFWIHRFNDIAFDYILEQATRKLPGYMISHERLLKLKYVDEENGTEYMRTLRLYLDNHLNAVQTARDLFVHRSTFLYRLDRIRSVLGTDLTDPEEILYLMLSFRLMDREEPASREEKAAGVGDGVGAVVVP